GAGLRGDLLEGLGAVQTLAAGEEPDLAGLEGVVHGGVLVSEWDRCGRWSAGRRVGGSVEAGGAGGGAYAGWAGVSAGRRRSGSGRRGSRRATARWAAGRRAGGRRARCVPPPRTSRRPSPRRGRPCRW